MNVFDHCNVAANYCVMMTKTMTGQMKKKITQHPVISEGKAENGKVECPSIILAPPEHCKGQTTA